MTFSSVKQFIKKTIGMDYDGLAYDAEEQAKRLGKVTHRSCDVTNLGKISEGELKEIFTSGSIQSVWEKVLPTIESLELPETMSWGINPGDRRSLFYLIYALQPKTVLEIGTHIGCSTAHIALALKELGTTNNFTTVDIIDVNDPVDKPWKDFHAKSSPAEMIKEIKADSFTQFKVLPSLDFFKNNAQKFDFIFLDGLHYAYTVYQEIPLALQHLNPGGFILLHDYFPHQQSLWEGQPAIVGPYLGVERLLGEKAPIDVIPLGKLPWPTKLGTNITSLALVTKT